jgi:hypothetical protein
MLISAEDANMKCTKESLKETSPFTCFFANSIAEVDVSSDLSHPVNAMLSESGFRTVRDVMHLYPLWAAALHSRVERFTNEATIDSSKCMMPRSNATVESRFRL